MNVVLPDSLAKPLIARLEAERIERIKANNEANEASCRLQNLCPCCYNSGFIDDVTGGIAMDADCQAVAITCPRCNGTKTFLERIIRG